MSNISSVRSYDTTRMDLVRQIDHVNEVAQEAWEQSRLSRQYYESGNYQFATQYSETAKQRNAVKTQLNQHIFNHLTEFIDQIQNFVRNFQISNSSQIFHLREESNKLTQYSTVLFQYSRDSYDFHNGQLAKILSDAAKLIHSKLCEINEIADNFFEIYEFHEEYEDFDPATITPDTSSYFRELAAQNSEKMVESFKLSQKSFQNNEMAAAKHYSDLGKFHQYHMQKLNAIASALIFAANNRQCDENSIDFHGLFFSEVGDRLRHRLESDTAEEKSFLIIIIGVGNHSVNNQLVIDEAVAEVVQSYALECEWNVPRVGCVTVQYPNIPDEMDLNDLQ